MSDLGKEYSERLASFQRVFISFPSGEVSVEDTVRTSVVLVVALFIGIPTLVLGANVPLLALIPLAGLGYCAYIYYTDQVFSGMMSAFFILALFKADIPLLTGPGKAYLSLYLADVLAITLFGILAYDVELDYDHSANFRLGAIAVVGAAMFVLWSYLSAVVGNGPSQFAAAVFAIDQSRYLLYFTVSVLIAYRADIRIGLYPLALSIAGNLLYAIAEGLSGHTFGLTYLGDADGIAISELAVGSHTLTTGLYAGGFTGQTRELIALLLLLLPFLVFWTIYGSRKVVAAAMLGILGIEFVVKLGETDAGWMASIIVLGVACGVVLYSTIVSGNRRILRGLGAAAFGVLTSGLFYADRFQRLFESKASGSPTEETGSSGTTGGEESTGGSSTSGGGVQDTSAQERLLDLLAYAPIKIDTLGVRLTQYAAAIDIGLAYPLFGIGGYNFVLLAERYGLKSMGIHNTFFSHLAAVGFPGALAYTISVLAVFALVGRQMFLESGRERVFWGCALAGLLGFHAYSFWVVIYGWQAPNAGFWAFSGMIVGALALKSTEIPDSPTHA